MKNSISKLFAKKLRIRMAALNISATDLSNKINVSRNTINLCRSGKAKMVKFETIAELSKGLYVQPDYFLRRNNMKKIKSQSTTLIKKCDECGKAFDLNDGNTHYYDAQLDIYLCSDRCLYDSFFEQVRDITVDYILRSPEYNVVKFDSKKVSVA